MNSKTAFFFKETRKKKFEKNICMSFVYIVVLFCWNVVVVVAFFLLLDISCNFFAVATSWFYISSVLWLLSDASFFHLFSLNWVFSFTHSVHQWKIVAAASTALLTYTTHATQGAMHSLKIKLKFVVGLNVIFILQFLFSLLFVSSSPFFDNFMYMRSGAGFRKFTKAKQNQNNIINSNKNKMVF